MLINPNKRQLAIGLDWSIAQTEAEMRAQSKRDPKRHRAVARRPGQIWLGLYSEKYKGEAYAGALVVGLIEPNAIVCEDVSDGMTWLCAIQDGTPLVGHDKLVKTEESRRELIDWNRMWSQCAVIGSLKGAKMTLQEAMDAFEQSTASKEITAKQVAETKIRPQRTPASSIAILVLMMALPLAGFFGWQHWKKVRVASQLKQMSVARLADEVINAEKLAAQRKLATEMFHEAIATKRAELVALTSNDLQPLWEQWEQVRRSVPLSSHGYRPQKLECDDKVCQLTWIGSGALTRPADKLLLPGVVPDMEPNLTARSEFPLAAVTTRVSKSGTAQAPATAADLRFAIANDFMGMPGVVVEPMQAAVISAAPELGLAPRTLGAIGTWKAGFGDKTSLVQAREFQRRIAQWPMKLAKIRYSGLAQTSMGEASQAPALTIELDGAYGFLQPGDVSQ